MVLSLPLGNGKEQYLVKLFPDRAQKTLEHLNGGVYGFSIRFDQRAVNHQVMFQLLDLLQDEN
jgi:hypothetical protein